jgi:hypothetical protein
MSLLRTARKAILNTIINEGRSGLLGKADGTVIFTDSSGTDHRNLVWVRIITDASVSVVVAENSGVPLQPNLPIRVADRNGVPTVVGVDTRKANIFTGGYLSNLPEHAWTHGRFGPDPLYITGPAFLPLMARPTQPADMTVTVEEGWFRWESTFNVWQQAVSSSMAAYVPTSAGVQHFIVLSLNRSTNTLTITDGTDGAQPIFGTVPFTTNNVLTIVQTLGIEHYPIAAIRFYNGQTEIKATDIFKDLRLWGGEHGLASYTQTGVSDDLTITDSVSVSKAYNISIQDDVTITDSSTVITFQTSVQDDLTVTDSVTVSIV